MYRYVIKRVLFLIPTILGVTFIIFFVMGLTPGNPGRMILGPTAKQEAIDALNHDLGYDLPIAERYVNYLKDIPVRCFLLSPNRIFPCGTRRSP